MKTTVQLCETVETKMLDLIWLFLVLKFLVWKTTSVKHHQPRSLLRVFNYIGNNYKQTANPDSYYAVRAIDCWEKK